jgi:trehalose 6-phosphate phosphatase
MRIWFFDFDGTLSRKKDRNTVILDPACASMLKDLSQSPSDWVAVISSRSLEDLISRIPLADVIIGGNSGLRWQLPGGCRLSPGADKEDMLQFQRKKFMPWIEMIGGKPGIEVEDKLWSVSIHLKKPECKHLKKNTESITAWAMRENLTFHHCHNVIEIQMINGFNKSIGTAFLASLLKIDSQRDTIIYAGNDENDAIPMWWAQMAGGKAIIVGAQMNVPGAIYVKDQQSMVDAVQILRNNFEQVTHA